jgi:hypothetical protein
MRSGRIKGCGSSPGFGAEVHIKMLEQEAFTKSVTGHVAQRSL